MEAFCPKCGSETEGVGPRGLCADCYLEENDLLEVPEEITVTRCPHCGSAKIGMDWVEAVDDQDFVYRVLDHEIAGEDVRAVRFQRREGDYHVGVIVEKVVDGVELQQELETWIRIEEEQCPTCSKFYGGYYEYEIQVRGDDEMVEEALEKLLERAAHVTDRNRENFVSNVDEAKNGYDIYVSSRAMAEELLKVLREQYRLEEQRSKELIGEEEGQRVYRSVVSARIS